MSYLGNPIVSTDFPKDTFSGNGSTTAFTMSIAPASVNSVIVVVSGITQDPSTYTISGTTLTFSGAPPTGTSNISVRHLGIAGIPNTPSAGSVVATSIADGVITAAKFASGQTPSFNGITFPASQSASADANTLDDYEEGTFTPSLGGNTTYNGRSGNYIKIGKLVFVEINIFVNAIGTGSTSLVSGLPFTSAAQPTGARATLSVNYFNSTANLVTFMAAYLNGSATTAQLQGIAAAGTTMSTIGLFGNGTDMYFSGCYYAAN